MIIEKKSRGFFTSIPGKYAMALFLTIEDNKKNNEKNSFDEVFSWLNIISKMIKKNLQNAYTLQLLINSKNLKKNKLKINEKENENFVKENNLNNTNNLYQENNQLNENQLIESHFPEIVLKFINLLFRQKRIKILPKITECFKIIIDEKFNREEIFLITSEKLKITEKKDFEKKLSQLFKKDLKIQFEVDKKILGGFIIKRKMEIINASGKLQIELFKKQTEKFLKMNDFLM